MTTIREDIPSRDFVNSLARGLDVLRVFSHEASAMTLSEVAARAGLSRAGARRLLLTLVALGYASKDGRMFRLTPRYLALGQATIAAIPLSEVAKDCVNRLARELSACVSLAVLEGDTLVQVATASGAESAVAAQRAGNRHTLYNSLAGRVFLALMPGADRIVLAEPAAKAVGAGGGRASANGGSPHGAQNGTQQAVLHQRQLTQVREQGYLIARPGESNAEVSVLLPVIAPVTREPVGVLTASWWRPQSDHTILADHLPALRGAGSRILEASVR